MSNFQTSKIFYEKGVTCEHILKLASGRRKKIF